MENIISANSLRNSFKKDEPAAFVKYELTEKDIKYINDLLTDGFHNVWKTEPNAKRFLVARQPYCNEITYETLAHYMFDGNREKINQLGTAIFHLLNDAGYMTVANFKGLYIYIKE